MATNPNSISRRAAALAVAALSALLVVGVAAPAQAVTTDVSLIAALADPSTTLVTLENDVTVTDTYLDVHATNVTLDLAGFDLTAKSIDLANGVHLTVIDSTNTGAILTAAASSTAPGIATTDASLTLTSGVIHATGGGNSAGIGGTGGDDGGTVLINGATVVAVGGVHGAGIGGGLLGDGFDITISAGTVTATGGGNAAGIGGGNLGSGHDITVSGGTVTATGGYLFTGGAGIGGGGGFGAWNLAFTGGTTTAIGATNAAGIGTGAAPIGSASAITIGVGAVVNATSGGGGNPASGYPYPSAVGGGENTISDGDVTIAGTLNVYGHLRHNGYGTGAITIASTGVLGGTADIRGQNGAIVNNGTITAPNVTTIADAGDGLTVTNHNYLLSFVDNAGSNPTAYVRVFATSMVTGNRVTPTFTRPGWIFNGWLLTGPVAFTMGTPLSANTLVYADWFPGSVVNDIVSLDLIPTLGGIIHFGPITAGQTLNFIGQPLDILGNTPGYLYNGMAFAVTDPAAIITGTHIEFRTAGVHTVTATIGAVTGTLTVTVLAGPVDDVSLVLSATTVNQGGSLTFEAWTVDAFGNPIADVTNTVVLTSDVATDVIAGSTVAFPHASPHVLTATLGAFSASVTVQVLATLAITGVDATLPLIIAIVVVLLGAGLLLWRRLRSPRD